jgi:hypothetical protein
MITIVTIPKKNQTKGRQNEGNKIYLFNSGSCDINLICPHQTTSIAEGPWSIRPTPHHRSRLSIYSTMVASTDENKITNKLTKPKQK